MENSRYPSLKSGTTLSRWRSFPRGNIKGHGAIVVDRNPGSSAGGEADKGDEAIGREQSLGHPPVVSSLADRTTGAVAEAVVGVIHDDFGRSVQRFESWIDGAAVVARRSRRIQIGVGTY